MNDRTLAGMKILRRVRGIVALTCLCVIFSTEACAKQTPPSPPPPAEIRIEPASTIPRSPIGTGLDGLISYSTEFPFNDIFKTSSPWMSGTADVWDDGRPLDLDEHGWVRSLRRGQRAITVMMFGSQMWVPDASGSGVYRVPAGRFTVTYEGEGTIEYDVARVVEHGPGRDVIELTVTDTNAGLALYLTAVNPRNHIRNIRVLMPNAKPDEIFNPAFIESLRGYRLIRFLGWTFGPTAEDAAHTPHVWSQRPLMTDARWESSRSGPPIEIMADLVNRLDVDAWFNIPHEAEDEFVRSFAELLKNKLEPDRKVYIEHSNEVWNPMFPEHAYAERRGLELGLAEDAYNAGNRYHARRTREIGAIFREVLGRDRVVVLLAGQADYPPIADEMLAWNGTAADVDALATAPYFGYELGLPDSAAVVGRMTLDQLFRELETKTLPQTIACIAEHAEIARRHSLPLITYEAGQHLCNLGEPKDARVEALFDAANRDPRMGRLYTTLISEWSRLSGGGLFTHLMHCGQPGSGGRWGLIEYQGQPRAEAPKYDAVLQWIEGK